MINAAKKTRTSVSRFAFLSKGMLFCGVELYDLFDHIGVFLRGNLSAFLDTVGGG